MMRESLRETMGEFRDSLGASRFLICHVSHA